MCPWWRFRNPCEMLPSVCKVLLLLTAETAFRHSKLWWFLMLRAVDGWSGRHSCEHTDLFSTPPITCIFTLAETAPYSSTHTSSYPIMSLWMNYKNVLLLHGWGRKSQLPLHGHSSMGAWLGDLTLYLSKDKGFLSSERSVTSIDQW